jgi:hypothetical protein
MEKHHTKRFRAHAQGVVCGDALPEEGNGIQG